MKTIIIVSGHGNYATGLQSSIELIAGKNGDLYYLDLTVHDTDITLKGKMNAVVKKNAGCGILFICDILGGTPFKVSVGVANHSNDMEVVAGCNIGSILEGIFQKDKIAIGELADFIVCSSRKSTVRFEKIISTNIDSRIEAQDGI